MGMIYAPSSIIPNGALINGVCHIYQSTKPTARPDGSTLVIGDIWYNTTRIVKGFWNGTYWVSSTKFIHSGTYFAARSTTSTTYVEFYSSEIRATIPLGKILITQCGFNFATNGGNHDASNNYTFLLAAISTWVDAENGIALDTFNSWHDTTLITTSSTRRHRQTNLALYLDTETPGSIFTQAGVCTIAIKFRVNTGSPRLIYGTPYITYREVL